MTQQYKNLELWSLQPINTRFKTKKSCVNDLLPTQILSIMFKDQTAHFSMLWLSIDTSHGEAVITYISFNYDVCENPATDVLSFPLCLLVTPFFLLNVNRLSLQNIIWFHNSNCTYLFLAFRFFNVFALYIHFLAFSP